jgi:hypothetical protein
MQTVTVRLPEDLVQSIDTRAEKYDTSRATILRTAIDYGMRAPKYDGAEFPAYDPTHERADAVELARRDDLRP